jgi:8-oxo-dGTP pyrophosphatase MutT (NUDIX family)
MASVVWIVLRKDDRFLLTQRSVFIHPSGAWVFPGGKITREDETPVAAAHRELARRVGINGRRFRELCHTHMGKHDVHVFYCDQWNGKPNSSCNDVVGVGWFTLSEIYALGHSLAPFVGEGLAYLAYFLQHYSDHPREWLAQWREVDGDV